MRPEFEDLAPKCSERVRIKTGLNAYTYSPVLFLHQPHGHGQGHCKPFAAQYCFKHTTGLQYTSISSNKCFVCECARMPHQLRATPHLHSVETRCDKRIGFVIGHVFGNHQHPHVPGNHPAIWKVTEFARCTPHIFFLINDENITIKKYSSFCLSLSFFFSRRILRRSPDQCFQFFSHKHVAIALGSNQSPTLRNGQKLFFLQRKREETTKPRHHQNQHLRAEKSFKKGHTFEGEMPKLQFLCVRLRSSVAKTCNCEWNRIYDPSGINDQWFAVIPPLPGIPMLDIIIPDALLNRMTITRK